MRSNISYMYNCLVEPILIRFIMVDFCFSMGWSDDCSSKRVI